MSSIYTYCSVMHTSIYWPIMYILIMVVYDELLMNEPGLLLVISGTFFYNKFIHYHEDMSCIYPCIYVANEID